MFSELTTSGWIFFIFGWGVVWSLTAFCLYKVLTTRDSLKD